MQLDVAMVLVVPGKTTNVCDLLFIFECIYIRLTCGALFRCCVLNRVYVTHTSVRTVGVFEVPEDTRLLTTLPEATYYLASNASGKKESPRDAEENT